MVPNRKKTKDIKKGERRILEKMCWRRTTKVRAEEDKPTFILAGLNTFVSNTIHKRIIMPCEQQYNQSTRIYRRRQFFPTSQK